MELKCYLDSIAKKTVFKPAVEKFEKDFPNIKVTLEETGDYEKKIAVLVAAGEQVDVMTVGNPIVRTKWAQSKTILPIDDLAVKYGFDFNKEYGKQAAELQVDGKYYSVACYSANWFLVYNKAMFDAAGLPYPSADKAMTWTEYVETAKKLTKGEGADKKYGAFHMTWTSYWYTQGNSILGGGDKFYTSDGKASNIEDPAWEKSIKTAYDMQFADKSVMPYTDVKIQKLVGPSFNTGKFGMFYTGSWILDIVTPDKRDFKIGIAPLPIPDEKSPDYTYTFGSYGAMSLTRSTKYQDEAFKMMVEVSRNVSAMAENIIPAIGNSDTKARISKLLAKKFESDGITEDEFRKVVFEAGNWILEKFTGPAAVEYENAAREEVEKYFTDMQDLDTTIKNIKNRGDDVIQKALKTN